MIRRGKVSEGHFFRFANPNAYFFSKVVLNHNMIHVLIVWMMLYNLQIRETGRI